MSERLDKGAKALCERFTKADTWDRLDEGERNLWRDMFRVALVALRVPTEAMQSAALDRGSPREGWEESSPLTVWRRMIDEALR